jgi:ATP-dependent helicase/nuclease subunit A
MRHRCENGKTENDLHTMTSLLQYSLFDNETVPEKPKYGPELPPQQAKVRDHGAGNQVVVAGAGTGKTEALTQRILKLLVEGDDNGPVELESILALTFTDKGAAEMRERVYARLVQISRAMPRGERRDRLERIRADFGENNRILTFDSFSMRLLRQFPQHSPLAGDVEILDGSQRGEMRREATRQFWNRVESTFTEPQKSELWELLDVFSSRSAAFDHIQRLAEDETEEDLRALAELPPEDEWREEFAALVSRDGEAMWRDIETQVQNLSLHPELHAELLDAERIMAGGRGGIVTQKDWSAGFATRWSPDLIPGLNRVGRKIREWKAEVSIEREPELDWRSRRVVTMLCEHALWWRSARREWCEQQGVATFSDVAAAALEMLGNAEVAARMRAGISHLLIDEFQDTNWRQWALLDALRDRRDGNVLIVGDEKQAIFRFRGGDITVFDGVRKILLGEQTAPDEMTISRRSTKQLVGWVNSVFRTVLPSRETRLPYEAPFQALESEKSSQANGLWKIQPGDWHFEDENAQPEGAKFSASAGRERAGRALARFLRVLCDDAAHWKASETPILQFPDLAEVSRKISRDESAIGIIFTTHAVKAIFEEQLRAFDVPFVSVKGSGFWGGEPVTWTLQLLRLLLDGNDRTAFVALARSPLGGLSDVALMEWHLALQVEEERPVGAACFEVDGFVPSRPEDAVAWELLVSRLQVWRDMARVEAASEVIEHVLEHSELSFYEAGLPDAAQREQNWRKIVELLREREEEGQGGLRTLIDYFEDMVRNGEEGESEADAPLPAGGSIQLMTVFASKGLGFPMTILAQLDGTPQNKGTLLLRGNLDGFRQMAIKLSDEEEEEKNAPKPWLWEKLRAQEGAEEEAQWRRLFYVACTRAESHLVVVAPENEVKSGAAWTNLCADGQREMIDLRPVGEIPRERQGNSGPVSRPGELAPVLPRALPDELGLGELAGEKAARFAARARAFLETHLKANGAEIREEVPFSAPASVMGIEGAAWVVGAWEWVALWPGGQISLAATGEDGKIASRRAHLMALAARDAGFEVYETWALWPCGEQTEAALVEG